MKQGVQTDTTYNIQQYWELLANNVASISAFAWGYNYESKIIPIIIVSSLYSVEWFMQCLEKFKKKQDMLENILYIWPQLSQGQ